MKFSHFATYLHTLETTPARNEMMEVVAKLFQELDPEEITPAVYLIQGRLVPAYVDLEFNFSQKLALRALGTLALAEADEKLVKDLFAEVGDVGLVAERLVAEGRLKQIKDFPGAQDLQEMNITAMHSTLQQLAEVAGKGSQEMKLDMFTRLILGLDATSARYVSRMVIGKLRLGLSNKTILDALSFMVTGDKSIKPDLERAFGARADLGALAATVRQYGTDIEGLQEHLQGITIQVGTPVAAKLVEREKSPEKVFERLGEHLVQPKLDGMRAQIHFDRKADIAEVYSRNMESLTDMFPDILAAVARLPVDSVVIDSEVVGYDFENQTYLPFQLTIQRRRKHDIEATAESIPVRAMSFDLLYLNGEDVSQRPVQWRIDQLRQLMQPDIPELELLESLMINTETELSEYFFARVGEGLEGLICKKLDTTYDPGTRNFDWIKLKANTQSDLVDTVDVVVIGYYVGRGARSAHGIGALLTAVYDAEAEMYRSVAKVGSGFKDEDWTVIKQDLAGLILDKKPTNVDVAKQLTPDVWILPQIVIEVEADEITRSPSHTAALGRAADFEKQIPDKGLSLRFPRLKVWNRDKQPHQATSVRELLRIFDLRKGS